MFQEFDLIVINTDSMFSKLVHLTQVLRHGRSTCGHVGVVIDVSKTLGYPNLCLIEATKLYDDEPRDIRSSFRDTKSGVMIRDLYQVIDYCKQRNWDVYRFPLAQRPKTRDISPLLFRFWRSNYQFSLLELLLSRGSHVLSDNVYCSQFAAYLYKYLGIYKGDTGLFPDELVETGIFSHAEKI